MLVTVVHKDYNVFVVGEVQMSWEPFIIHIQGRVSHQFRLFDRIFFDDISKKKTRFALKTKI